MHTHASNGRGPSVGAAAKDVAEHAKSLVRLELELAALELKRKLAKFAIGIALVVGAAVLLLFGIGFALATVAAAFATFLSTWLALLVVAAGLLTLAGVLAVVALVTLKKAAPPVPEQAIREAKLTSEALKS
jgi:uncharacterized membrane protein YqjE